jgi:hypothetical protein
MPQGMKLKSEPFASNLWDPARRFTYEKYLADKGVPYRPVLDPIPIERFLEYGQWFRQHAVGDVRRVKVRCVARADGAYSLGLEDGTVSKARRVILATGYMGFRNVPDVLKGLPDGMCLHSTVLHDVRQLPVAMSRSSAPGGPPLNRWRFCMRQERRPVWWHDVSRSRGTTSRPTPIGSGDCARRRPLLRPGGVPGQSRNCHFSTAA